jgi:hypothetical protein
MQFGALLHVAERTGGLGLHFLNGDGDLQGVPATFD